MTDGISDMGHRISDGGNSVSIEEKMDMLRRKIKAGTLGADDARRALRAEIDGELRKAAADVDMDAVNACEALLAELSSAKEETHAAQNLRAIREKLHPQRRAPKRSAAVAALLAAALVFGGTATVLGLAGNDHTKRLEELQENRTVQVAQITPENETRVTLPIDAQTLTLEQAAQRNILDETGKLRVLAQTLTDVDEAGGVRMLLVLAESAEEMHVDGAYLVGFDADGKRLETAVDMSVSPALLAGGKSLLSAEIEPGAMDGAERFEIWLNIERSPTRIAEEQDADAELRDHYFVATLTKDADDSGETDGYVSIWATDAQGMLLDGFNASLDEGEQLLAGETWTFEKRIGSWVTLEQEDNAETGSVGYRMVP